jgi:RimJ/RimL family protein N-acetyltransferase
MPAMISVVGRTGGRYSRASPVLETERLLLRRPTAEDAGMAYHLEQWERAGIGKFVVVRRADGVTVGRVGIQLLHPETWQPAGETGVPELGWTLHPEHRGRGYATEAARAVRDWYQAERLVSLIPPDNVASQAVARRLGAVPGAEVHLPRDGMYVIWEH